jgi:hypothetical protein
MASVRAVSSDPLDQASIRGRFTALSAFLAATKPIWSGRPFVVEQLPWEDEHPETAAWLRALSNDAIDRIEAETARFEDLAAQAPPRILLEWRDEADALSAVVPLPDCARGRAVREQPGQLGRQVPDRKWRQVLAFISAALGVLDDSRAEIVDWCAGKGHVGRTVGVLTGRRVVLLEQRQALETYARERAGRIGARVSFEAVDVLDDSVARHLDEGQTILGLHACGILTDALIDRAIAARARSLLVATCCYHRLGGDQTYRPMSCEARATDPGLAYMSLRLATGDETKASPRIRARRRRELAWRLGLDELVREGTNETLYRDQGRLPSRLFRLPFGDFCRATTDYLYWDLPRKWNEDEFERRGRERARSVRARGLVRGVFRRAIEVWITIDRALYLEERGWNARIGTFCERALTPRNIAIAAEPRR